MSASQIPIKDETVKRIITDDIDLARAIAAHNTYGSEVCGWEKP